MSEQTTFINRLKEKFSKRRLKNLEKNPIKREFIDIDKAKEIGMIVNMNICSAEDVKLLRKYISQLKKESKKIFLIELNFLKKSAPEFTSSVDAVFINPSKLNWFDYPVASVEGKIKQRNLDILMNFDASDRITSKYLCSLANAKTRTGTHTAGYENCYELMIDLPPNLNGDRIPAMIKQYDYFLKMLEK